MQAAAVLIQPTAGGRPLQVGLIGIEQGKIVLPGNQGNHKLVLALETIVGWGHVSSIRSFRRCSAAKGSVTKTAV